MPVLVSFSDHTTEADIILASVNVTRPWDSRLLVNGTIDKHAYDLKAIETSMPFAELKRRSHIDDRARAADQHPAFSSRIRAGLPQMSQL